MLDKGDPRAFVTAFQWRKYQDHASFRETMHPDAKLKFSEASCTYMSAMTREQYKSHVYLPLDSSSRPSIFSPEATLLLRDLALIDGNILTITRLIDAHERTDAPVVSICQ